MDTTKYEQMGIAALLPGLIHAREIIDERIAAMQSRLDQLQRGAQPAWTGAIKQRGGARRGAGRPPKTENARQAVEELRGEVPAKRRGRPRGVAPVADGGKLTTRGKPLKAGYWAKMTAEERAAGMARRVAARQAKLAKTQKLHPRDAAHPGHADWLKKMQAGSKRRWDNMTKKERAEVTARMLNARAARVNGAAAEHSA